MLHVAFVDDEPAILSGIRRLMFPMRSEWRMSFATSGEAAIEVFETDPADVVVSDMRMPGMDGSAFLAVVRQRWPGSVRIILSGHADQAAALRSIPVAHRFISKPCQSDKLLSTVRSACDLQDRLSRPELRQLIGGLGALPSPPTLYAAITEAISQPDVSTQVVASIIERDPACAAKLLQLTNSAFFGLARSITGIRDAVTCLGLVAVRDVVLATETAQIFHPDSPAVAKVVDEIIENSLAVAIAARDQVPQQYAQEAFAAGLLHDIGRMVFAVIAPDQFLAVQEDHRRGVDLTTAERERLGATHAEVGGYLLRLWNLPFSLIEPVVRHHDPDALDESDVVVAAIAAAVGMPEVGNG